jgi:hypothetical protein
MKETVYGIYSGCRFEGGGVGNIMYRNIDDARKALMEQKDKKQAEIDDLYSDDPEDRETFSFKQMDGNDIWQSSIDVIEIQEFEVV